jgi:hypothetical protein
MRPKTHGKFCTELDLELISDGPYEIRQMTVPGRIQIGPLPMFLIDAWLCRQCGSVMFSAVAPERLNTKRPDD